MKTVIEMALEAGFETLIQKGRIFGNDRDGDCTEELEAFAALVRADERNATLEEIAKWLEDEKDAPYWAELVRARGSKPCAVKK